MNILEKLKEKYENSVYLTGIYKISLKTHGSHFYIGMATKEHRFKCSCGFYARWKVHLQHLRRGCHRNRFLQRVYDKYGEEELQFEILEFVDRLECPDREYTLIKELKPSLNFINNKQSLQEVRLTEQQRKNISDRGKGRKHTKETKLKISMSNKGNKNPTKGITIDTILLDNIIQNIYNKSTIKIKAFKLDLKHCTILERNLKIYHKDFEILKNRSRVNGKLLRSLQQKGSIHKKKYSKEDIEKILYLYEEGKLISEISTIVNLNNDLVGRLIKENMDYETRKQIRTTNAKRK